MSVLPSVPLDLNGKSKEYLIELVRQLERELRIRPTRQTDGAFYVSEGLPFRMVSPDGTIYAVAVDNAGNLTTTVVAT